MSVNVQETKSESVDCYLFVREGEEKPILLLEPEERYRLIVEHASNVVLIIDFNTLTVTFVSPAFQRILGFNDNILLGKHCLDLVYDEDRKSTLSALIAGKEIGYGTAQYRVSKSDGSIIWVEGFGEVIHDGAGNKGVLVVARDISESKRAHEALQQSEEKYRLIVDNAHDGISIINVDGLKNLYANTAILKATGYSQTEYTGRKELDFIHPEDRDSVLSCLAEGMQKKQPASVQFRYRKKDGSYIWVETTGRLFPKEDDSPKILLISRNISQRKMADEVLRKHEEELRNKVNYLNTLINNMNELFYTLDADFKLTFGNQKAVEVTGYTLEEALGKSMLDYIPDKDKDHVLQSARKRISQGTTGSYEHFITCRDGGEILIKVKSSPIVEDDEITGIMVLAEDITAQRKMEKEMIRLGQLHTVGEMAASIGHEIRNPMTTVHGFLQMMSQNQELSEYRPYFNLMLEELGRANSIITEFLSLAKDKLVDLKYENINRIVNALAPLLVADATKGDKYIDFSLNNVSDLLLDEKEIRQLILNLVRNGLEAMPVGGAIQIKTQQDADGVVLSVHDEGGGILPEIQEQLGTPFITSKENGTGLGLAVCYSIVERHRARMDYESSPAGTTFNVRFPAL